jgi:hypothetical protein
MITVRTLGSEYKPFEYIPVRTEYILFFLFLYRLFYISKEYIPGTC